MNKSYVIWNNKGGVGKSTITFHIASMYAEKNQDRNVVVIDMCPQANSSMMLMGGGTEAESRLQELIIGDVPKTVVGYLTDSVLKNDTRDVDKYLLKLQETNPKLPSNLFLMSGDGNLELIAPLLAERANAAPLSSTDSPWVEIHSIIKKFTQRPLFDKPTTFFIDTNPSFSIYTQIAILSGQKLLVPINADDSSIYAISGLFNLIWGSERTHPVYGNYTFAGKVDTFKMERPKIALLLGNRFTQKMGAAHAFKALSQEAVKKMFLEYKQNKSRFVENPLNIETQQEFERAYSCELRDFNSAGVVAANQGLPLSKMLDQGRYTVYEQEIQVSKIQRDLCHEVIEALVARL
ncbi:AAA family ATPase [Microcoleus sp. LEGE 07076]|uniref:ParA family protein n=1 Tax=Microcoleus sp. LEGE 07076 TaxID=915322 RepID=UPI001882D9AC|nr:ParA family protein [Microcoleus sp. LEGE 07076]MBE9185031.1 AAA family ATPase [Microcoleus sp. LEGE 07076]